MIGQGLGRRHHDAVAGMHPHRVDVLHVADGDAIVRPIPHHLVLDLLPTGHATFDQNLANHAQGQTAAHDLPQLGFIVDQAASGPAQGVGRAHHHRIAVVIGKGHGVLDGLHHPAIRHGFADLPQHILEQLPIFGLPDRLQGGAQQQHSILLQYP